MSESGKIVVIDDEESVRDVVKAYLEKDGFTVYVAANGRDGLALAERRNPDLIVLDLMLPDISGEEICEEVRSRSDVPIVMLTAKASEEERVGGLVAGADDYLVKPFSPRELVARVRAVLRTDQRRGDAPRGDPSLRRGAPRDRHRQDGRCCATASRSTSRPTSTSCCSRSRRYPGRAYSRFELVNRVQGYDYEGYERTIDVHVKNLRKKIEPDPAQAALRRDGHRRRLPAGEAVSDRRRRWGLRARLLVAFVAVALLGTVVTTVYSSVSLTSHLEASARTRLHNSADALRRRGGGRLAERRLVAAERRDAAPPGPDRLPRRGPLRRERQARSSRTRRRRRCRQGAAATAPVKVGDQQIGTVVVSRDDGRLFTGEEIQLRQQLLRMHLVAGVVSAVIAVLVALYLAVTLSRPLRRIRAGADAMSAGDLDARVPESGDDEIAAVADALNRLAETLQHEEGLRKESVADLAHELRTPVMGILARVEAAQDGVLDDEAANLSAMHDEALRLARLLDDLSALAEAERPGLLLDARAGRPRRHRRRADGGVRRRVRRQGHRARRPTSSRRSSTATPSASSRSS